MSEREIERWWRRRRVQDKPSEMQRFRETRLLLLLLLLLILLLLLLLLLLSLWLCHVMGNQVIITIITAIIIIIIIITAMSCKHLTSRLSRVASFTIFPQTAMALVHMPVTTNGVLLVL